MTYADFMETAIFALLALWFLLDRSSVYFREPPEEGDNDWGQP